MSDDQPKHSDRIAEARASEPTGYERPIHTAGEFDEIRRKRKRRSLLLFLGLVALLAVMGALIYVEEAELAAINVRKYDEIAAVVAFTMLAVFLWWVVHLKRAQRGLRQGWESAAGEHGWSYRENDPGLRDRWTGSPLALVSELPARRYGPVLEGRFEDAQFSMFQIEGSEISVSSGDDMPDIPERVLAIVVALPLAHAVDWTLAVLPRDLHCRFTPTPSERELDMSGSDSRFRVFASHAQPAHELFAGRLEDLIGETQRGAWRIEADTILAWDWKTSDHANAFDHLAAVVPTLRIVKRELELRDPSRARGDADDPDHLAALATASFLSLLEERRVVHTTVESLLAQFGYDQMTPKALDGTWEALRDAGLQETPRLTARLLTPETKLTVQRIRAPREMSRRSLALGFVGILAIGLAAVGAALLFGGGSGHRSFSAYDPSTREEIASKIIAEPLGEQLTGVGCEATGEHTVRCTGENPTSLPPDQLYEIAVTIDQSTGNLQMGTPVPAR
ncbi:MAG: hypothetical protein ACLPUT_04190 [Solirubrobacteraceae bacterium]